MRTMQGVTPTIIMRVPESIDLTDAAYHYVTFKQGKKLLLEMTDGFTVSEHQVEIYLPQESTILFNAGAVEIQLNWVYATGQRGATVPKNIVVRENHLREVLP